MKQILVFLLILGLAATPAMAADNSTESQPGTWQVESLVPMFFFGGYHAAVGYRQGNFRIRASVIYGGDYDAEQAGADNSANAFKRFYDQGSYGVFGDYFIWKGLHAFVFVESHNWIIESKGNDARNTMSTIDYGPGIGYQFYIGDRFYIQPAIHLYFRDSKTISVGNETYSIPSMDRSFVLRLGYNL
jgi:hypothetical protein